MKLQAHTRKGQWDEKAFLRQPWLVAVHGLRNLAGLDAGSARPLHQRGDLHPHQLGPHALRLDVADPAPDLAVGETVNLLALPRRLY